MKRSLKSFGKDLLVCLSLTNLCFVKVWARLLDDRLWYFDPEFRNHQLVALLLLTIGLALLFALAAWLVRRSGSRLLHLGMRWLFLLAVLITFVQVGVEVFWRIWHVWVGVTLVACIAAPIAYFRWHEKIRPAIVAALLIVSPFVAFTSVQAGYWFLKGSGSFRDKPSAPLTSHQKQSGPVVWIIFDELDEKFAFEQRPPGVSLPEFDRFRSQALFATNAQPPADGTFLSIPALLSGKPLAAARPQGANKLLLRIASTGQWVSWGSEPNIFTRAKAMGVNSALVGWYHPYCRVFADTLNSCSWTGGPFESLFKSAPYRYLQRIGWSEFLEVFGSRESNLSTEVLRARKQHMFLTEQAKQVLGNPAYGLVFLHLSVPHPPGLYDRRNEHWTTDQASYLDNLRLADSTLGELRTVMERAGTWDNSTVVISSDHWFRVPMWRTNPNWSEEDEALFGGAGVEERVPFMLKLPAQTKSFRCEKPFNTVITADLLMKILSREITDGESAARWIDDVGSHVDRNIYTEEQGVTPVVFRLPELLP